MYMHNAYMLECQHILRYLCKTILRVQLTDSLILWLLTFKRPSFKYWKHGEVSFMLMFFTHSSVLNAAFQNCKIVGCAVDMV